MTIAHPAKRSTTYFNCPNCGALYHLIKVESGPETVDQEISCRSCGGPLQGREGGLVLKYLLINRTGVQALHRRRE
jgi:predicted RNA-binding Zn-ribbon protein involved in translation (DUF1610 family)